MIFYDSDKPMQKSEQKLFTQQYNYILYILYNL